MGRPTVFVAVPLSEEHVSPLRERCDVAVFGGRGQIAREELLEELREAEGLLATAILPLDAGVLDRAPRLRVVSNIGVGYDNVDLEHTARRGIVVANTPGILSGAMAELTMGLMLMLSRRLREAEQFARGGSWARAGVSLPLGNDLAGKTLAIIGMGRIGREVARRALAFGMRVLFYDPVAVANPPGDTIRAPGLSEALREADFVSLHTTLTAETRHLIGARELAMMKPGAYLVNTSRGSVVDQAALYQALVDEKIAGAALDVLEEEPPAVHDPLVALPNVIVTPHIGTATVETRSAMIELAVRNLVACLFAEPCECIVNVSGTPM